MKRFIGLGICICMLSLFAMAKEGPKPEVFGGYQFTRLDGGWHGNGWDSSATLPLGHWFGVSGDFSGGYGSGTSLYTYTFGPQISTRSKGIAPFAHALFGGAHASNRGVSSSGMAMFFGGGGGRWTSGSCLPLGAVRLDDYAFRGGFRQEQCPDLDRACAALLT